MVLARFVLTFTAPSALPRSGPTQRSAGGRRGGACVRACVASVRIGSPYVVYVRVAFGAAAGPARRLPPMVLVGVRAGMGLATLPAGAVPGT